MDAHAAAPPRWGAWADARGRVDFGLWAPDAQRVELLLGDGSAHAMRPTGDGYHALALDCSAGTRYRYRIDGGEPMPDPASRWQPDDVHGASAVLPADGHRWRNAGWQGRPWAEAVIYELHVGACGGYAGVSAQLPQLAAMGITAIELMPLAEFPGRRNWGYDGVMPYAPESAYGHPDQLKALVDQAHGLGLMVLLDVVYNHFGPDGNYLGRCAPQFFRHDVPTPWGAAIDFRRPQVREFFLANARMWLHEYRFDGLRLDAVHAIVPASFLDVLREDIRSALPPRRHVHLVLENEHNQASLLQRGYTAQWNDDYHNALHVLLTGEREGYYAAFADDPAGHLARVLAEGFAFQGQADHAGRRRGEPSAALPPDRFVVFAQNHDQVGNRALGERLAVLVSPARLRAALALTALVPMIPLFFMGEPWGARAPFLFFTDLAPPLDEAVREGRRREFAHFSAFADPARRAAIPDPNDEATFRASRCDIADAAAGDGARWREWFGTLLAMRREVLVPTLERARSCGAQVLAPAAVVATWRLDDGRRWQLAVNFGAAPVALPAFPGRIVYSENIAFDGTPSDGLELPPDGLLARLAEAGPA
ncbi:malto-oligosyltrehalose trehalohydrolase [Stenotrophomonas sp. MMGLT7]|uniref:malto-oligosyltrehalose trehalohydrolase n=1 Tax=Stenotrophomonas sp. MMGLT7 TaxID=2901227 RepID=UPI001E4075A1|nr:malto-oligosyltrehalose trehalohydrolase [Stenotrophomonas sp. MMGLT7]MCD7098045.1 malto-oligosyltrehalose trehalohydrolase [Stenotrophomonas sp. MMGLT7]